MSGFLLNPYDASLDLSNKDDRKLYHDACKGLPEKCQFDGKKENFQDFIKLIEKEFKKTRVMEALEISTEWDDSASDIESKKMPTARGLIDIFKSKQVTQDQILAHSELVWASTAHGSTTPRYFKRFNTPPTTTNDIEDARNQRRLKHVMMGWKLWNSLTAKFQIEITSGKQEFERNDECDGPLLWDYIRRRVNPTTTVGASKLKDDIETKKLSDFDHDIIRYNTWFCDTRESITKEEGEGYTEYLRSLFRAYQTSNNQEFLDSVAEEKRKWTQGKLRADYDYTELMELGRLTFNNLVDDDSWSTVKQKVEADKEKNFLALATEILQQAKIANRTPEPRDKGNKDPKRTYKEWRYQNPDGATTKVVDGTTMSWCTKDCHAKPMWCGRTKCHSKAEFAEFLKKKGEKGTKREFTSTPKVTDEFKIALAALTTPEDYAMLDSQFFQVKE